MKKDFTKYKPILNYFLCLCLIATLITGCSKSEGEPAVSETETHAITFRNMQAETSRAVAELADYYDNFMVYGLKHTSSPASSSPSSTSSTVEVLPRYQVQTYYGGWSYDHLDNQFLKFWDYNSDDYIFTALAPYPTNMDDIEITTEGEMTIRNIRGNTVTSTTPMWLVAQTGRNFSTLEDKDNLDPTNALPPISAYHSNVPLRFHRFLAQVEFLAWSTRAVLLKEFRVSLFNEVDMPTKGDYSVQEGTWENITNESDFVCNNVFPEGIPLSQFEDSPTLLSSKIQIPQSWPEVGRVLAVNLIMTDGKTYSGTINLNKVTNKTNSWQANNIYRYTIKLDIGDGDVPVILFAVDMDTWKWREGNSIEDTQTDW